jgi:hypothetical protein
VVLFVVRKKADGQSLPEYAISAAMLLLMALGAYNALDLKTLLPKVIANNMGGTAAGQTVTIKPMGSL